MKNRNCVITAPLLVTVILLLVPISEKLLTISAQNSDGLLFTASAVQMFIFAVPSAFYCKIRGLDFLEHSKVKRLQLSDLPFTVAAAFTCFFSAIMLMYIQLNLFPNVVEASGAVASSDHTGILLTYVIVPALAEEFFFRSILISDYADFKGPCAVIVSSLFFAMLHFSLTGFISYFILGIILATITYVTNTSFPATIVHLIYNATIVYGSKGLSAFLKESSSSVILAFLLTVVLMISIASMLSAMENVYATRSDLFDQGELPGSRIAMVKKIAKAGKVEKAEVKRLEKTIPVFLSPTFFLCILVFILITVDII